MEITSATIGIPVSDLAQAQRWYEAVFELGGPDAQPIEGIVEYRVGDVWLQLSEHDARGSGGVVLRFGVDDVSAQHRRLAELDVDVSPIVHVEGAVDFFDVLDPGGTMLSFYTVVS